VALGADDVQAAQAHDFFVIANPLLANLFLDAPTLQRVGDVFRLLIGEEFRIAAQQNVGAAAGHVGGDRDRTLVSGLRNDFCLALVILRVQHDVRDAGFLQHRREQL